ncbi:DnaJ-domain-containing protein [Panus rudis PR-1116 ss-1]|nr:DnaJ-domain-containing protein [Panus rudis PR-1116 ss-1]
MAAARSFYDVLGIAQDATPEAVRKAYKRKVLQTHPDKLPPNVSEYQRQKSEALFREVRAAFDVLSDPAKRKVYDNGLNFIRGRAYHEELSAKLARERQEWARQAAQRHAERMQAMREETRAAQSKSEELRASAQQRYQESMKRAEEKYREHVRILEEQLQASKERMRQSRQAMRETPSSFAATANFMEVDDWLEEFRRQNPEWEARRQAAMRESA